jgi:hypothetical protein
MVTYDHTPHGVLEKTTSLFHRAPRALSADLMRFEAFVEMTGENSETNEKPEQQADKPRTRHDEDE